MQIRELKRIVTCIGLAALGSSVTLARADTTDRVAPNAPSNQRVVYQQMSVSEMRFASALYLISTKCLSCHRAGGSALDFGPYLSSEAAWAQSNLVVPKQSQNSLLFKYLIGSGFSPAPLGTMPVGGTLSPAELDVFRRWIDNMPDPSAMPTPTPTPVSTIAPTLFGLSPSASPHLGDRIFIKTVLDRVFGPAAATTTDSMVKSYISIFGGACDVMNQPPATGQADDSCPSIDAQIFFAPVVPQPAAARAGQTMKACNALAFNDTTLQYAIKAATNLSDLNYLKTDPIPKLNEIITAYGLFGPQSGAPSAAALGQLAALAQAARVTNYPTCPSYNQNCQLDPWRYLMLALCYNPAWQVI